MNAVVVTEDPWTDHAGQEHHPRNAHVNPKCSRVKATRIVARDVPIDTREAGLPCTYCWPSESETAVLPDPAPGGAAVSPSDGRRGPAPAPGDGRRYSAAPEAASDRDRTLPAGPPDAEPPARPTTPRRGSNKYAGVCYLCRTTVMERCGVLRRRAGKWTVQHLPGECNQR